VENLWIEYFAGGAAEMRKAAQRAAFSDLYSSILAN
jgi:hypothetical protein